MADADRRARSAGHYLELPATDALRAVVDLARRLAGADAAAITIIGGSGQRTVAAVGIDVDDTSVAAADAACVGLIDAPGPVVVTDAVSGAATPLTSAVLTAGYAAYVAIPLVGREGLPIGALSIAHTAALTGLDIPALAQCGVLAQQCLEAARNTDSDDTATSTLTGIVDAFTAGTIRPWYMPIIDLTSNRVRGVEALARWTCGDGILCAPDQFIPILERTDYIIDFDLTMLRHTLDDLTSWRATTPSARDLGVTVNFSAHHFYRPDCVERIEQVVHDFDIAPTSIAIEITETASVSTRALIDAHVVEALRDRGYRVMLDDIGGMWLPAPHLLAFDFDGLKADRAIGSSLDTPTGLAVARALTTLTADLGAILVIEGIETSSQADRAAQLGATYGQGFYWSPPRPPSDVLAVIDSINSIAAPAS